VTGEERPSGSNAANAALAQQIAEATGFAVALGVLGVIASLFQIFGVIELGVPGWFNLSIAVAVIVLGLTLHRRSLVLTGLLAAIFVGIAVDTLVATGILLERGGWPLAIVVLIRYAILLAALRAFAAVFMGVIDLRRAAVNEGALDATAPPARAGAVAVDTAPAARSVQRLALGTSPSTILFGVFAGFLALVAVILLLALPLEGPVPLMLLLLLSVAGAMGWAAHAESRHVPKLIGELRQAVARGDQAAEQNALHWLGRAKGRGARALAMAALECQANDSDTARAQVDLKFARTALEAIIAIGSLDRDAASALLGHFVPERCEQSANVESWQAACAAARSALTSVGYELKSGPYS
jgi:hypothetical protein